ncbi:MAG: hypothetical protein ACMXYM_02645 [Candidatus Woesearchaeota archaeon]
MDRRVIALETRRNPRTKSLHGPMLALTEAYCALIHLHAQARPHTVQ